MLVAKTILLRILLGWLFVVSRRTTTASNDTFMGYSIEYTDTDAYTCLTTLSTVVYFDTSSMCLTSTVAATTTEQTNTASTATLTVTVTNTVQTVASVASGSVFVAPTCGTQSIGLSCNLSSDACSMSQPCLNDATCFANTTLPLGYLCSCTSGFSGTTCEVDNRSCRPGVTCLQGGTCSGTTNTTSSTCQCRTAITGHYCQLQVDACVNITCQNAGQCISDYGNWSCRCLDSSLFSGTYCQIKSNSLIVKEIMSRSLAIVAIGCLVAVISFVIIMDILKYVFKIDPVAKDIRSWREKKDGYHHRQKQLRQQGKQKFKNRPQVITRLQYIHVE